MKHKQSLKPPPIKAGKRVKPGKGKLSTADSEYELGVELIWVKYPMQDHAAWPYLNRPASSDSKIWVRWQSTGRDDEIDRDQIQELTRDRNSRRRCPPRVPSPKQQQQAPAVLTSSQRIIQSLLRSSAKQKKMKSTQPKRRRPRKDPHPQQWPHAPYSEATVQSREIQLGDYVHRDKDLFRVMGMACFYSPKRVYRDFLTLVNVRNANQVIYEYMDRVEPGMAE